MDRLGGPKRGPKTEAQKWGQNFSDFDEDDVGYKLQERYM